MDDLRAGLLAQPETGDPQPGADVDVLDVKEESLVETAERQEILPRDREAGSAEPFQLQWLAGHRAGVDPGPGEDPVQPERMHQAPHRGRLPATHAELDPPRRNRIQRGADLCQQRRRSQR